MIAKTLMMIIFISIVILCVISYISACLTVSKIIEAVL